MLISRRKEGETLMIGEDIEIRIVAVHKKKVIVGVVAPRDVKVKPGRLSAAAFANTVAAVNSVHFENLIPAAQAATEKPVLLLKTLKKTSAAADKKEGELS